jgi:DNA-binding transcriptional ArsR family regulator
MARALLAEHQPSRKAERRLHNRRSRASHLLVSWDNLINPIIQTASLLAAANDPSNYLSDVISAVRYLLACSGAIANDAPLLDSFPELADQRKAVLSCLSRLVVQTRSHEDLARSANELIEAVKEYAAIARESGMGNPSQNTEGGVFKLDDSNVAAALKIETRERNIADKLEGHRINVFSLLDDITDHGVITFERRAEILEMTRKAVEAVRAYLSVLERDLASESTSLLEDPNMVSIILSKEAIYTAATNLVTAVRVASSSYGATTEEQKEDNEHVQTSIERVRVAILDSLRAIRFLSNKSHDANFIDTTARERLEMSASLRRAQTLSYLSRKATSLDVLKGQYLEDVERERENGSECCLDEVDLQQVQAQLENHATSEGRRSLDEAHALIRNDQQLVAEIIATTTADHVVFELESEKLHNSNIHIHGNKEADDVEQIDALAVGNACAIDQVPFTRRPALPNKANSYNPIHEAEIPHTEIGRSFSNEDVTEHQRHRESSTTHVDDVPRPFSGNSVRTSGTSSRLFRQSMRSSIESYQMTPFTSPEPMSPISDVDSITYKVLQGSILNVQDQTVDDVQPPLLEQVVTSPAAVLHERPYSQQPQRVAGPIPREQRSQQSLSLPPQDLKVASSKSTPTDNILRQVRRSRGMSVSSIKMSLRQHKEDDSQKQPLPNRESTHFKTPTLRNLRRVSSWRDTEVSIASSPEVKERKSKEPEEMIPWFLEPEAMASDDDSFIINGEGQVMGGTLKALIERLTMHDKATDITFSNAFLLNFHLFTTSDQLVELLKKRFSIQPPGDMPLSESELEIWTNRIQVPIRLRVYNVMKTWLEGYFSIEHDQNMRDALMDFAADTMAKVMPGPAKRMVELINRRFTCGLEGQLQQQQVLRSRRGTIIESQQGQKQLHRPGLQKTKSYGSLNFSHKSSSITGSSLFSLTMFDDNSDSTLTAPPPAPIIPKSLRQQFKKFTADPNAWQQINLLDIDPVELARQMTLIENSLYCDIAPQEMLGQEFKKKVGISSAIHVKAMIQLSTRVTGWIADSVLNEKEAKRRAAVIKYWIKVGDSCLQLQNYNTLMAIRSALDSTGVSRLRRTWDLISTRHKNNLEIMRGATDTSRNFAKYRQRLKGAIAPCLPFLGVYLTDMTFIDDGNSNVRTTSGGKELINFDKHIKATKVISEIQRFQIPYRLVPVEELQHFLHKSLDAIEANDQELYTRSLRLEPREDDIETRSAASSERS